MPSSFRLLATSAVALHLALALPQTPPHTCTEVDVVQTNLGDNAAAEVLRIYREVTEESGADPNPIAKRLMEVRGGFWDVMMIGTAFSYSVTCLEFVELASAEWNVLLCQEAVDADAEQCGSGMRRYANGTLTVASGLSVTSGPSFSLDGELHVDQYANYMTDDVERARAERVPVVQGLLEAMLAANALHTAHAADEVRRQLWPEEERTWNVLVEVRAGGHYYYSEEQFNLDLRGGKATGVRYEPLTVAILLPDNAPPSMLVVVESMPMSGLKFATGRAR